MSKKETALDNDATLYQGWDEHKSSTQHFKEMNFKEKVIYFKDYFLWKSIIIIALLAGAIFLTVDVIEAQKLKIITVAVLNDTLNVDKVDAITEDFATYISETEPYESVHIDDTYSTDNTVFNIQFVSGGIDILIASYTEENSIFSQVDLAAFVDLSTYLPTELYEKIEPYTVSGKCDDGSEIIFGFDLSSFEPYQNLDPNADTPVLCFAYGSESNEFAVDFFEYLLSIE